MPIELPDSSIIRFANFPDPRLLSAFVFALFSRLVNSHHNCYYYIEYNRN